MRRRKRSRGFTLMELLVALVLVAILVSIAVTRYMGLRDKSMVAAATFDLDLVRKVLAIYATDYSRYPLAAANYEDLKSQMVDPRGQPYGRLPLAHTYSWLSYTTDVDSNYIIRIQVADHRRTVLRATPNAIVRE